MQALAIFTDSIRELRSRSLFWVTLILSVLSGVLLFGLIGFNEDGWRILWFETNESESIFRGSDGARQMLAFFFSLFVRWWVCWAAIVLALMSTASVMPSFLASGSIDLVLSKPIGRIRIYVLKIIGCLLFVLIQTTIAVVVAFLLLGGKQGVWIPATLWAIPLVLVQFLYLFSVSVFVGVMTRSTLASLLATFLFWAMVSIVQFASNTLESSLVQTEAMLTNYDERIANIEKMAESQGRELNEVELGRIERSRERKQPFQDQYDMLSPYLGLVQKVEFIVPKTADIQKIIAEVTDAPTLNELIMGTAESDNFRPPDFSEEEWDEIKDASNEGESAIRNVDRTKSLGSSMILCVLLLGLGGVIFVRRDF